MDKIAGQLAQEIVSRAFKCTQEIMADLAQTNEEQNRWFYVMREITWCFMHIAVRIGHPILGVETNRRLLGLVGPLVAVHVDVIVPEHFPSETRERMQMDLLNGYNAVQPEYLRCEDLLVDPPFSKRSVIDSLVFRLLAITQHADEFARMVGIRQHVIAAVKDLRLRPLIQKAATAP